MKKVILVLTVMSLTLTAADCSFSSDSANCHRSIRIVNNSDKTVKFYMSFYYPDSTLNNIDFKLNLGHSTLPIKPHTVSSDGFTPDCMEAVINHGNKDSIMIYFVLDYDVVKNYPKDTIIKYGMYLRTYYLTVEGLQKDNWTVTYP
jgi:hypothetical protein